jgi:hypothetical protein
MMRNALRLLALLAVIVSLPASAGQVRAFLDRDSVQLGESVTLNVQATDVDDATVPDFDVLVPDFVIIGNNSQQSYVNDNGHVVRTRLWAVALQPRRAGTLRIPALAVGSQHTEPLTLTVSPASNAPQGGPNRDVFVEATADPASAYVGQQVLVSVRLFYAGALAQGQLDAPQANGADVQKLGDDLHYQAERNGRMYNVVERRYTLFAHKPGKLVLPAIGFRGQMQDNGFGGFFGGGRSVSAASPQVDLDIKPPPVDHGSGDWLPARKLELTLTGLPADGRVEVGKPLTLTLAERAEGLPFEALPELSLPSIDGAEVYPDKPTDATHDDGRWLQGSRERKFAIVPTRAGALQLPAITLEWWNTQTDQRETATVPAHTLQAMAVAGAAIAPASAATSIIAPASAPVASPVAVKSSAHGWRVLALALFSAWLATLVAWTWSARRARAVPAAQPSPRLDDAASRRAFRDAADAAALSHHLLAWARSERPGLRNLGELAAALDDDAQRAAIAELERQRYGTDATTVDPAAIKAAFRKGFAWRADPGRPAEKGALPPLYPR